MKTFCREYYLVRDTVTTTVKLFDMCTGKNAAKKYATEMFEKTGNPQEVVVFKMWTEESEVIEVVPKIVKAGLRVINGGLAI